MNRIPFVIDNIENRLADVLNHLLSQTNGQQMDVATAYFSIRGYKQRRHSLPSLRHFRAYHQRQKAKELDDGIHSGLHRSRANGIFFYFTAARPDQGRSHFWRYYDLNRRQLIDNRYGIMQLIACTPETPRFPVVVAVNQAVTSPAEIKEDGRCFHFPTTAPIIPSRHPSSVVGRRLSINIHRQL